MAEPKGEWVGLEVTSDEKLLVTIRWEDGSEQKFKLDGHFASDSGSIPIEYFARIRAASDTDKWKVIYGRSAR